MTSVYRFDPDKPRRQFDVVELLQCAKREALLRRKVYANRVDCGRMTPLQADREIAMMLQICEWLRQKAEQERLL